ncbi:MAG: hypothetical protein J6J13_02295 [Clostridia bacterium]|nr:hypothetical protein [Clostridia bacterium]
MMRKISKIIALILAIAMVLCPVLTAAAETEDVVYSTATLNLLRDESGAIAVDENGKSTAIVTVTTLEAVNAIDFQINFAKGVAFDISADTVAIDGIDTWSVQKGYKDGVLTVAAYDNSANFDQAQTEVVFNITVTIADLGEHEFYLSKIFAVGEGEANAEYVASFKYADEAQSGVIDVVTAKTDAEVDYFETTSCLHPNTTIVTTDATCTEAGSVVETCDDCGKVISSETTDPLGHSYDNMNELCCLEVAYDGALYAVYDAKCAVCGTLNVKYYDAEGNLTANLAELAETDEENVVWLEDIAPEHDIATEWSYNEAGHWHDCSCGEQHDYADHTWDEGTVTTAAQPGVAGVMTYACTAACGATKTEEIPATGPVLDESLKSVLYKRQMLIRNKFGFYFTLVFGGVQYDDFEFTVSKREISATTYSYSGNTPSVTFSKSNCDSNSYPAYGMYYLSYADISIFEMSVDITYTLTIYEDGVATKYYTFDSETLAEVADIYYTENFSNAVNRSMAVDILNLGTAAQTHFAAQGPAGNTLSTFSAPNANIDQQYKTPYGEITEIDGIRDKEITTQMLFKSAPSLYYTINLAAAGCTDPSALTFTATYYSKGLDKTETRTVNGSELSTEKGGEGEYGKYGLYYFAFDQVALFDTNKLVTLTITNGTDTWTYEYSVESQLSKNINDTGTVGDLYRAVASFAASARNFWPDY